MPLLITSSKLSRCISLSRQVSLQYDLYCISCAQSSNQTEEQISMDSSRLCHPERCVKQRQDAPLSRSFATIMDLPSSRELELEALLRKKDSQLADLTVCSLVWRLISCSLITLSWRCVRRTRSTPSASISRLSLIPLLPSPCLCHPHSYPCS